MAKGGFHKKLANGTYSAKLTSFGLGGSNRKTAKPTRAALHALRVQHLKIAVPRLTRHGARDILQSTLARGLQRKTITGGQARRILRGQGRRGNWRRDARGRFA